ncbi:MAG TPA: cell wall-binding repeat-containing protein, partial [Nocardioidaceae bacterium]|nr:cell wall-binding repeat-containing protein [Nocardioidaceae bacterium]
PILLTPPDRIPDSVLAELGRMSPSRVVILGGTGAISPAVASTVRQNLADAEVTRVSGEDRYATSAAVGSYGWATAERAYFAAGTNFPDALAGVAAAAFHDAPLLLTRDDCLPGPVFDVTTSLAPQTKLLLGGSTVLNEDALEARCA